MKFFSFIFMAVLSMLTVKVVICIHENKSYIDANNLSLTSSPAVPSHHISKNTAVTATPAVVTSCPAVNTTSFVYHGPITDLDMQPFTLITGTNTVIWSDGSWTMLREEETVDPMNDALVARKCA
jgi:hypothetical protein